MLLRGILLQTFLIIVASFVLATAEIAGVVPRDRRSDVIWPAVVARAKGTSLGPQNGEIGGNRMQTEAGQHSSHQTISVYPPNVRAQRGEQNVLLGCNVTGLPGYGYIKWSYYPTWHPSGITIYTTYNNINNDPTNFTVYHRTLVGDTQSLDLVIKTAKPELATQYKCDFGSRNSQEKSINVVVLGPMVTVYPPIVGAQRGEQNVVLGCNITGLSPNNHIEWIYYPTWEPTGFTIYSTYDGINNDPTNFTVMPMTTVGGTQSLDLVINMVKPELATQYRCDLSLTTGFGQTSNVVVLDKTYCSNDVVEYHEGNEANISCSVNYYASTLTYAPRIAWKRDGKEVPGVVHISDSSISKTKVQQVRLTKNVTSADNDRDFVCVVDFFNANPDYTDNCYTAVFVRHPVSEITFNPPSSAEAPIDVAVGDVINCIANGRPAPTIEWYTKHSNLVSTLSELSVRRDMRSWKQPITLYCRANNSIDNGVTLAMAVGIYTFNVVDAEPIVPSGGTTAAATTTTNDAVGEIGFYPPSSAEAPAEVAVGAHIICLVHGKSYSTIEWYDKHWNWVSGWNQVTVTKEMRSWKQPITLQCRARNQKNFGGDTIAAVEASYTFNVVDAEPIVPWGGTTAATTTTTNDAVGEISFYPPSSAEAPAELAVGAPIICLLHGKSYSKIYWYDKHWNWVSGWNQVTVTKEMRYSEQPITLHCRVTTQKNYYGGDTTAAVEASYTFRVSGAVEPWVIAMAVIVPIVVLVAIAIAVFFRIRHRKMKEKYRAIATKEGSTSALLVNY